MDSGASSYNRFLQGDKSSFNDLVELYSKNLMLFINGIVKDISVSEDLMEDTFLELLINKKQFKEDYKFKTWLFKIARNKAIDYLRKNSKKSKKSLDDMENDNSNLKNLSTSENIEENLIKNERHRELHSAMGELNADYRQVLYLIYFENMSYNQVAKVLKKTNKQIDNIGFRAKKALKNILERKGFRYEE
jgi:RNA polymerase sigma-70 factor (ECF subfamily)